MPAMDIPGMCLPRRGRAIRVSLPAGDRRGSVSRADRPCGQFRSFAGWPSRPSLARRHHRGILTLADRMWAGPDADQYAAAPRSAALLAHQEVGAWPL